ncbi:hypothetical protein ACFQ51_28640 [Streptomyces kaempferi]
MPVPANPAAAGESGPRSGYISRERLCPYRATTPEGRHRDDEGPKPPGAGPGRRARQAAAHLSGRPTPEPSLLTGGELLQLDVRPLRLGEWYVEERQAQQRLDEALADLGQAGTGNRHPLIAVGSNASPGQVAHKLTRLGIPATVPMVPVRVHGIGVGCSGHISPAGYVAGTPYVDRGAATTLVVTWLDPTQLKAVDDTEFPDYRRAILPGDAFEMTMPSGERLGGAYIYFSAHGVLADPATGRPRPGGGDQAELLAALLAAPAGCGSCSGPIRRPGCGGPGPTARCVSGARSSSARRAGYCRRRTSCRTSTTRPNCGCTTTCRPWTTHCRRGAEDAPGPRCARAPGSPFRPDLGRRVPDKGRSRDEPSPSIPPTPLPRVTCTVLLSLERNRQRPDILLSLTGACAPTS